MGEPLVVLGAVVMALAVLGLGFLAGWLVNSRRRRNRLESSREEAARILDEAQTEADALKKTASLEAKDEWRREREPLERLASEGQLKAHCHSGYWQCMDTHREQQQLEALWAAGDAPWKIW